MLHTHNAQKILFLDIETVPQYAVFEDVPEGLQKMWVIKSKQIKRENEDTPEKAWRSAGIWAEFGKIICISVGILAGDQFHVKSFSDNDEKKLLEEFSQLLNKSYSQKDSLLCAHNGKEFDFPYIARRMLILGIPLPQILDLAGKKPWEVQHLDTMELWKFGDYKNYTSLNLLATVFNIPTPKDDIDGSQVYGVYYNEKNLERIVTYCQKDVLTVAQIFRRMRGEGLIPEASIVVKQ